MQLLKPLSTSLSFFAKLEKGEKLPEAMAELARQIGAKLLLVTAIGGFSKARLAVFEYTTNTYHYVDVTPLENHVLEVIALNGNIVCRGNECKPHLHAIVARKPGQPVAGHLVEAEVNPFLEVFLVDPRVPGNEAVQILQHRFSLRTSTAPLE